MSTDIDEQQLLADPSTSFWLKEQIEKLPERDILDAAFDAELLPRVADKRFKTLLSDSA